MLLHRETAIGDRLAIRLIRHATLDSKAERFHEVFELLRLASNVVVSFVVPVEVIKIGPQQKDAAGRGVAPEHAKNVKWRGRVVERVPAHDRPVDLADEARYRYLGLLGQKAHVGLCPALAKDVA